MTRPQKTLMHSYSKNGLVNKLMTMSSCLSVVDLFAGIGGFSLGFIKANKMNGLAFDIRLLVDSDPSAAFTFKKNFPRIPYLAADINNVQGSDILSLLKIKSGDLDFLIGGPPCQGFSASGKRWLEDNRNLLISRFIEIAHELKPKCLLIENVPGALAAIPKVLNKEFGEALKGYVFNSSILNASEFRVPQIRKRAFIVAIRKDIGISDIEFPKGPFDAINNGSDLAKFGQATKSFISVEEAIGDLPALKAGEKVDGAKYDNEAQTDFQRDRRIGSLAIFNHVARVHSKPFIDRISAVKPGQGKLNLPDGHKYSDRYFSQAYARLHPEGISFTITANFRNPGSGRFMHYRDNRSITVREAARLQSFDDSIIFHGFDSEQERHVGNAVPPLLAEALAFHFGSMIAGS